MIGKTNLVVDIADLDVTKFDVFVVDIPHKFEVLDSNEFVDVVVVVAQIVVVLVAVVNNIVVEQLAVVFVRLVVVFVFVVDVIIVDIVLKQKRRKNTNVLKLDIQFHLSSEIITQRESRISL